MICEDINISSRISQQQERCNCLVTKILLSMFNGVGVNRSSSNILNCPPWILDCKDKEFNKWEFQPVLIECAIYYILCTRIYARSREKDKSWYQDYFNNKSTGMGAKGCTECIIVALYLLNIKSGHIECMTLSQHLAPGSSTLASWKQGGKSENEK